MKRLCLILGLLMLAIPGYAGNDGKSSDSANSSEVINPNLWKKDRREFRLGYTFANLDRGSLYGGSLDSRWGLSLDMMNNIYLHRKAIGNFLKFGIQFGAQINYANFEKGHGSIKDMMDGGYDEDIDSPTLGKHQLIAGIGIGPTATFAPFFKSCNKNLSRLKFRVYFNVVPSYSAIITSDEEEMEFHNAFACMFAGGFNVMWRKLDVGFQYKGGRARYKNLVDDLMEEETGGGYADGKTPRFATNLWTISVGLVF